MKKAWPFDIAGNCHDGKKMEGFGEVLGISDIHQIQVDQGHYVAMEASESFDIARELF